MLTWICLCVGWSGDILRYADSAGYVVGIRMILYVMVGCDDASMIMTIIYPIRCSVLNWYGSSRCLSGTIEALYMSLSIPLHKATAKASIRISILHRRPEESIILSQALQNCNISTRSLVISSSYNPHSYYFPSPNI